MCKELLNRVKKQPDSYVMTIIKTVKKSRTLDIATENIVRHLNHSALTWSQIMDSLKEID